MAGTKISDVNDVAWLFRALEDEAVEHTFALYKFKDDSYLVQHLSTGGITSTVVDLRLLTERLQNAARKHHARPQPSERTTDFEQT